MDVQTFGEVMGWSLSEKEYKDLLPAYLEMMERSQINNVNRAAMLAAQLGHESVGLSALEEFASGSAYEWRSDLGNVYAGDGVRFKGRGAIMVTGRLNYSNLSKWAHGEGLVPTSTFFVDEPKQLQSKKYAFIGAIWYWTVARPQINSLADVQNLEGVTRAINGGVNGLADRRNRYARALKMGVRLLASNVTTIEKRLDYPRDQVTQDTYYNCGPASAQTIIRAATGKLLSEVDLGAELGTHKGGTDYIGQFPAVLNRHLPEGKYTYTNVPGYLDDAGKQTMFDHFRAGVDAGFGSVVNIVAPPSNYPKASYTSTQSPAYSGGTVYHYIAVMGYAIDSAGQKHLWIADSGFQPFGYWIALDQLATLIVPKGYAYPTAKKKITQTFLEELMTAQVNSFINPGKTFPADTALSLIDASNWRTEVLTEALLEALGLDTSKILATAIEADNAGADRTDAIRAALNLGGK